MTPAKSYCEISIRIASEDGSQKYTHKIPCYEQIQLSHEDPSLCQYVEEAKAAFKGDADEISLTIKYTW
jgi:hypothetical protein